MVIASAAIKRVMTGTAKEGVIARIAVERVIAVIATERVVAFPTVQGIIAVAAAQAVVTGVTVNGVVAVMRPKGVITGATVHGVVRFPAFHVVVVFRCVEVKGFFDDVFASQLVVFKLEVIAVAVPLEEIILERYLIVAAAVSPDDEIVAFAAKSNIAGLRALKAQGVSFLVPVG